ncbi:hypothetical protein TNCV_4698351 [Trichonephila clavipes]|nr:hypothetical protein TNCV_4698351 [Trichonephila clavipes]
MRTVARAYPKSLGVGKKRFWCFSEADMAASPLSITQERKNAVTFSSSLYKDSLGLIFARPEDREQLVGLKLASLKQRWLDGNKWPVSTLRVMESIANKWHCYQEGRQGLTLSIDICTGSLLGMKCTTV